MARTRSANRQIQTWNSAPVPRGVENRSESLITVSITIAVDFEQSYVKFTSKSGVKSRTKPSCYFNLCSYSDSTKQFLNPSL